jgi:hypothetical protein
VPISSTTTSTSSTTQPGLSQSGTSRSAGGGQGLGFQLLIDQSSSSDGAGATNKPAQNPETGTTASPASGMPPRGANAPVQRPLNAKKKQSGVDQPAAVLTQVSSIVISVAGFAGMSSHSPRADLPVGTPVPDSTTAVTSGQGALHGAPMVTNAAIPLGTMVLEKSASTAGSTLGLSSPVGRGSTTAVNPEATLPLGGPLSIDGVSPTTAVTAVHLTQSSTKTLGVGELPDVQGGLGSQRTLISPIAPSTAGNDSQGSLSSWWSKGRRPDETIHQSNSPGAVGGVDALPPPTIGVIFSPVSVGGAVSEVALQWSGTTPADLGALATVVSSHLSANPSLPSTLHLRLSPGDLGTIEVLMTSNSSGVQIHLAASSPALASILHHSANDLQSHMDASLGVSVQLEFGGSGSGAGAGSSGLPTQGSIPGAGGAGGGGPSHANSRGLDHQGLEPVLNVDAARLLDLRL